MQEPVFHHALRRSACALAATLACGLSQAGIVDAKGDYLATYGGPKLGDLDVLSASATYNLSTGFFTIGATMDGTIGSTPGGFYVWGVDRGKGTARFAANGITGVLFDMVVIINADGSGRVNDLVGGLAPFVFGAGTAKISGDSFTLDLDDDRLPTQGLSFDKYTWNLWPRTTTGGLVGFAQITDFAPDNVNFATTAIPEPGSALLAGLGLSLLAVGGAARRRRA